MALDGYVFVIGDPGQFRNLTEHWTILGSNIFNGLFIVSVACTITPINVPFSVAAPALILGFAAVVLTYPPRSGTIDRWRGGLLLAVYAVYLFAVFQMQ